MDIVAYKDIFKDGIIDCLKRNYDNMKDLDNSTIASWAEPMFSYDWQNHISEEEFPYKYGMVFLDNDKVVGYLGMIYSKQIQNGTKYSYLSPTTWAVDDKYRIQIVKAIGIMNKTADVIGDFSPRQSVEETLVKLFKYKYIDEKQYAFCPVPCLNTNKISIIDINDSSLIKDEDIKLKYIDHSKYNVKCICIQEKDNRSYIFYKVSKQKISFLNTSWIDILSVSNKELFTRNIKYINFKLQRKEKAFLKADSRFFITDLFKHPAYFNFVVKRISYSNIDTNIDIDMLYSEIPMLADI